MDRSETSSFLTKISHFDKYYNIILLCTTCTSLEIRDLSTISFNCFIQKNSSIHETATYFNGSYQHKNFRGCFTSLKERDNEFSHILLPQG